MGRSPCRLKLNAAGRHVPKKGDAASGISLATWATSPVQWRPTLLLMVGEHTLARRRARQRAQSAGFVRSKIAALLGDPPKEEPHLGIDAGESEL